MEPVLGPILFMLNLATLKISAEEHGCFIRDADNLVRCLAIELEIKFGLRSTVVPVGEQFELVPPQASLCEHCAFDDDAHARRLPGDPRFLRDRLGRVDDAASDETRTSFVLACEDEDRIACCNVLTAIHRLLFAEGECVRTGIADLRFDCESHSPYLTPFFWVMHIARMSGLTSEAHLPPGWVILQDHACTKTGGMRGAYPTGAGQVEPISGGIY